MHAFSNAICPKSFLLFWETDVILLTHLWGSEQFAAYLKAKTK